MTQSNFLIPETVLEKFKFPQEWCKATCAQGPTIDPLKPSETSYMRSPAPSVVSVFFVENVISPSVPKWRSAKIQNLRWKLKNDIFFRVLRNQLYFSPPRPLIAAPQISLFIMAKQSWLWRRLLPTWAVLFVCVNVCVFLLTVEEVDENIALPSWKEFLAAPKATSGDRKVIDRNTEPPIWIFALADLGIDGASDREHGHDGADGRGGGHPGGLFRWFRGPYGGTCVVS